MRLQAMNIPIGSWSEVICETPYKFKYNLVVNITLFSCHNTISFAKQDAFGQKWLQVRQRLHLPTLYLSYLKIDELKRDELKLNYATQRKTEL